MQQSITFERFISNDDIYIIYEWVKYPIKHLLNGLLN